LNGDHSPLGMLLAFDFFGAFTKMNFRFTALDVIPTIGEKYIPNSNECFNFLRGEECQIYQFKMVIFSIDDSPKLLHCFLEA
jgi:hypothetical protein